jgi:phenylacetaldehyde dehydrogenase
MNALPELIDYIDGELSTPSEGLGVWLEDPNTGERAQEQKATSPANVERALASAYDCHVRGAWAGLPIEERVAYLFALAGELDKRKAHIAELEARTTGAILGITSMLTIIVTGAWHLAIEQMKARSAPRTMEGPNGHEVEVHRLPLGVALCLVPWNAPAPMAAHKVANALAAGCPTILKPTEWAPHGCDVLAEAAHAVGLPKGALQIVHGDPRTGGVLVKDKRVRAVSFTGGLEGGRAIATACAHDFKPTQLELGGNNPVIVLEDADIAHAAQGIVNLMVSLNGQWCRALGRLIVHESIADALLEAVLEALRHVKLGHSLSADSQMGPLVHSRHLAKVRAQVEALLAKGGTAHASTPLPEGLGGHFFAPTLITGVAHDDAQDEIFAPVGTIHTFRTDEEALALANGTPYGLEAYLFARDTERALALGRRVHAGGVKVNGSSMMSLNLFAPRPAWGWSGYSEEGTIETFEFFRASRVIGVEDKV